MRKLLYLIPILLFIFPFSVKATNYGPYYSPGYKSENAYSSHTNAFNAPDGITDDCTGSCMYTFSEFTGSVASPSAIEKVTISVWAKGSTHQEDVTLKNDTRGITCTSSNIQINNASVITKYDVDITPANCAHLDAEDINAGRWYIDVRRNSGSVTMKIDAAGALIVVGTGSGIANQNNYGNLGLTQVHLSGDTGYTGDAVRCDVFVGQYCRTNGTLVSSILQVGRVYMDSRYPQTANTIVSTGVSEAYGFSPSSSHWDANLQIPLTNNQDCTYPMSLRCYDINEDGSLTIVKEQSADQNFINDNPTYTYNGNLIATSSATISIAEPNCNNLDLICWIQDKIQNALINFFGPPVVDTLQGMDTTKQLFLSKAPFEYAYRIFSILTSDPSTSSAIPVTSISFFTPIANTSLTYNYSPTSILTSQISNIKNVFRIVIYACIPIYLIGFWRKVTQSGDQG